MVVVVVEVVVVMMVVVTDEEAWSSNMFIQTVMFTRSSNPLGAPFFFRNREPLYRGSTGLRDFSSFIGAIISCTTGKSLTLFIKGCHSCLLKIPTSAILFRQLCII